jgi:hypothetical protein
MYKDSFVHVNFGSGFTNKINVNKGVKQGDPMASSLYSMGPFFGSPLSPHQGSD